MISHICPHYRYILFQGQETYECDVQDELLKLKSDNKQLNDIIDSYQPRIQKYKYVLQEIKAIAERGFNNSQCNCGLRAVVDQIIEKITKAESEG